MSKYYKIVDELAAGMSIYLSTESNISMLMFLKSWAGVSFPIDPFSYTSLKIQNLRKFPYASGKYPSNSTFFIHGYFSAETLTVPVRLSLSD